MITHINLLLHKKKAQKELSRLTITSYAVFIAVVLIAVLVLLYSFILRNTLSFLETNEANIKNKIQENIAKKTDILIVKERLSNIQKAKNARVNINNKLDPILAIIPSAIQVDLINASNTQIQLQAKSPNLGEINRIVEELVMLLPQTLKNIIKRVDLTSFTSDPKEKIYSFSLSFEFIK